MSCFAACLTLGSASTVRAQAWTPAAGEGTVSATYQNYYVVGHFDRFGEPNTNGGTHSSALVIDFDYGLTDSLALAVSLPFIASKYTGPPFYFVGPFLTFPGPLDDGTYHGAFQDLRVEIRRMYEAGPVAITPFIGVSTPTHGYETMGEAVPGRHRKDLQLGASAGCSLGPWLPATYVHARYSYAVAEVFHDYPFTRSNIDLEGGQALMSRLTLRGVVSWQIAHTGPTLIELAPDWEHHDRFIAPSYLNLGAGASISLTRSVELYALWVGTVSGSNGAHRSRLLVAGTTWSFGGGMGGFGVHGSSAQRARPVPYHD